MRPWALVTGASQGIGLALARLAAADGYRLVLVARDAGRLKEIERELAAGHATEVLGVALDLGEPRSVPTLLSLLRARAIVPELLINSAGVGLYGRHAETPAAADEQLLAVNVVAPTALTRGLLPELLRRGSGRILNVASTAAFVPGPYMAVYYASKAYVLSYSEALAEELKGSGVTVTALCPGPTATAFQARAGLTRRRLEPAGDPATVARAGYRALKAGRRVCIPGLRNRLWTALGRALPRGWVSAALARRFKPR